MSELSSLRINGQRLWQQIHTLAEIGATAKGGVARVALTDLDRQGRDWVCAWAKELGLAIRVDKIGNVFMRYEGSDPSLPAIMTGSHIDTQPTGGKFDGNYGVLAGLEVIATLIDQEVRLPQAVEVVAWTNEEGSRFVPVMMGSGVYAGAFTLEHAYAQTDSQGLSVKDELKRIGYLGDVEPGTKPPAAYYELHIEQGPVLENARCTIGVVQGVLGIRWFDCTVEGMEAHAGPTPMNLRKDAMQGAARIAQQVVELANPEGKFGPHGRGTVGMMQVHPNSRNVIPGRVKFSIDLRNATDAAVDEMASRIQAFAQETCAALGLKVSFQLVSSFPAQQFHAKCCDAVAAAAKALGYSHMPAVSGAGHDAVYLARLAPTGMIFIPCKDGISHNEIESATFEDVEAGANVLLQAMVGTAAS